MLRFVTSLGDSIYIKIFLPINEIDGNDKGKSSNEAFQYISDELFNVMELIDVKCF